MREKRKRPCLCRERREKKECENRMEERTVWRAESARSSGCLQQWASTKWKMESSFSSLYGFPVLRFGTFPSLLSSRSLSLHSIYIHVRSFFLPSPILEKPEPTTTQSNLLVLCAWTCVTRLSLSLSSMTQSRCSLLRRLFLFPLSFRYSFPLSSLLSFLSFFRFLDSPSFVWY